MSKDTSLSVPKGERKSDKVLYIVSLNHFMNDGSTALISSLLPAVILLYGFSKFEVGVLIAAGYMVSMVFQPITGRYSERFEARKLLALGISLIGVSMVMFTLSNTFLLMLLSILVLRFGSSFFHPVGVSAISRNYSDDTLDRAMGVQSAFGNLGILVVFLVSAPIYINLGWRAPFLLYALFDLIIVATTIIIFTSRSSAPVLRETRATRREKSTGRTRIGLPIFFITVAFISGGTFSIFQNYGNILLYQDNFGLSGSNYLVGGWILSGFIGAVVTGMLTRRFSRKRLLPLCYLFASLSTLAFTESQENALVIVVSLLINGFALSITYPAVYSELASYLGSESKKKGSSFGILFSSQISGASIVGFVSGYIAGIFGLSIPFEGVSLMLAAAAVISYFWTRLPHSDDTSRMLQLI